MMSTLLLDLRLALRTLLRAPGFLVAALLTLALGIGGTTAIFSKVDQLLLRPLPFPDADRLMLITECNSRDPEPKDNFSYPDFLDYQREGAHLASLSAVRHAVLNLTGDGEAEQLRAGRVAWNFFEVLQVPPALGRSFRQEEDRPGGARVAILSHGLWQRRFGGDPKILGRSLRVDGETLEVVGVMPKGFRFPYQIGNAEIFLPLSLPSDVAVLRGSHFLGGFGRLRPGVSRDQALQGFKAIAARLETLHPENILDYTAKVRPLQEELVADQRQGLLILMGAVALVLLIACANVANLLLAKTQTRERELAIRMALGADRRRLARLLLAESLVLSLMGGALGLVVAQISQKGLEQAFYQPFAPPTGMDWRLLLFALLCSVVTAMLFGLLPALQASGMHLGARLRDGAKGSAGPLQRRLRSALVVGEVALATALLVGAGLLIRSLWNLQRVELGFQAQGLGAAAGGHGKNFGRIDRGMGLGQQLHLPPEGELGVAGQAVGAQGREDAVVEIGPDRGQAGAEVLIGTGAETDLAPLPCQDPDLFRADMDGMDTEGQGVEQPQLVEIADAAAALPGQGDKGVVPETAAADKIDHFAATMADHLVLRPWFGGVDGQDLAQGGGTGLELLQEAGMGGVRGMAGTEGLVGFLLQTGAVFGQGELRQPQVFLEG